MEDIKDKINQNFFNLTSEIIRSSLTLPTCKVGFMNSNKEKAKEINREFSKSRMIDLYCDVSDNFEESKLRKIILDKNK